MREISTSELVRSLLDGAPSKVFDFIKTQPNGERTKTKFRMRVLRIEENHSAIVDSQKYAKTRGELEGYGDIYREAQAVELLTMALCHVEAQPRPDGTSFYPQVFTDSRQLRASFNEPELGVLLNCYQIVKSEYGSLETLDQQNVETWIARLSDELRGPFHLSQLDSLHWPGLILSLAKMVASLQSELGLPRLILPDTLESAQPSSDLATGDSSQPPSALLDGEEVPSDKILTRDEALARGQVHRGKSK